MSFFGGEIPGQCSCCATPMSLVQTTPSARTHVSCADDPICPDVGIYRLDRCWYLSTMGSSCNSACVDHGLAFLYTHAPSSDPLVPYVLGRQPTTQNIPWASLECFVPHDDRWHTADSAGKGASDPGAWTYPVCQLACPCTTQGLRLCVPCTTVCPPTALICRGSHSSVAAPAPPLA